MIKFAYYLLRPSKYRFVTCSDILFNPLKLLNLGVILTLINWALLFLGNILPDFFGLLYSIILMFIFLAALLIVLLLAFGNLYFLFKREFHNLPICLFTFLIAMVIFFFNTQFNAYCMMCGGILNVLADECAKHTISVGD